MKVLAVIQIHSGLSSWSSTDAYVCKEAEADNIEVDETEIHGQTVQALCVKNSQVIVFLNEDKTFYNRRPPRQDPVWDWSKTPEFEQHVQNYVKDGWSIHKW